MRNVLPLFASCLLFTNAASAAHGCHGGGHGGHGHAGYHGHSCVHYRYVHGQRILIVDPVPVPYDGRWNNMGGKLSLCTEGTRLLDPQGSMVPFGFQYFITKSLSLGVQTAVPLNAIVFGNGRKGEEDRVTIVDDHRYSIDLRHYFNDENAGRPFVGAEAFYRKQVAGIDSGGYTKGAEMFSYGHATVTKESTGAGLILGYDFHIWQGLMLELYGGVGLRLHTTWQDDIIRLHDDGLDTCTCKTRPDNNIIGTKTSIYAPLGARLTWTFGKMPR